MAPLGQWPALGLSSLNLLHQRNLLRGADQGITMYRICETRFQNHFKKLGMQQLHPQCLEDLVR